MKHTIAALLSAMLLIGAQPAWGSQGLGDAAKRAEEQRRANAGKGTKIEMIEVGRPLPTVKLDRQVVQHYVDLRVSMAKLWQRDPLMYQRVRAGLQNARTMKEYSSALSDEAPVAELLKFYGYTPETFVATELSLREAERLAEGGFDMASLSDIQRENYNWIGRDLVWLSYRRGHIAKAEAGMSIFQ